MYIEAALKGKNHLWRYIVSVLLFIMAYIIGQIPLTIVILQRSDGDASEFIRNLDFEFMGIHPIWGFTLLLIPFVVLFFTIILSVTAIHGRPLKTLFTGYDKFDWNKVFFAIGVMFILLVVNELVFYFFNPGNYSLNASWQEVLPFVFFALLLLPFQISAEELLLRGYLLQGLGIVFRYGFIAVIVTSVAFGLLHFQNPEVTEFGIVPTMIYYIGFGLFMGILVLMSGGLELSLGIHFIVNFYSIIFVTYPASAIKSPALFRMEQLNPLNLILSFGITAIVFLVIVVLRYKWKDWGRLYSKIKIQTDIN